MIKNSKRGRGSAQHRPGPSGVRNDRAPGRRTKRVRTAAHGGTGTGADNAQQWATSTRLMLANRFRNILANPPDGRRPAEPPTRTAEINDLLTAPTADGVSHDWLGLMVVDCGYETRDRLVRDDCVTQNSYEHQHQGEGELQDNHADSRTVIWLMSRDEYGRSVCVFVEGVSPYFYVGVCDEDTERAERMAPAYAKMLETFLTDKSEEESSTQSPWRGRGAASVVRVTPVSRRWFYGYKPDPRLDGMQPDWSVGLDRTSTGAPPLSEAYQASDWYLKVVPEAPYHVGKLREWAYQWSQFMELRSTASLDPVGSRWRIPVTCSADVPSAPGDPCPSTKKLCIFEANVEFVLRFMIDRGLVGAGFCAIDLAAEGRGIGLLRVLERGRGNDETLMRTSCQIEVTVDGSIFERAEDVRDRILKMDPSNTALDRGYTALQDAPLRFVARKAEMQQSVDGSDPTEDPLDPWFERLRNYMAPLHVMSFDIECYDPDCLFPDPERPEDAVIGICAYLYRWDRIEAWQRRRDVYMPALKASQIKHKLDIVRAKHNTLIQRVGDADGRGEGEAITPVMLKYAGQGPNEAAPALRYGPSYEQVIADSEGALRRAEDSYTKAVQAAEKASKGKALLQGDGLEGVDCTAHKWPPPLDVVALGLGTRLGQPTGDMDGYPVQTMAFESERELMLTWSQLVAVWDPDIIMGYNSVSFDMWYLFERARVLGIDHVCWKIGRFPARKCPFREGGLSNHARGDRSEMIADLHGRVQLDILKCRQADVTKKLRNYKLDSVARHFIDEGKTGLKYTQIPVKFSGSDADRAELDEYCLADAVLPLKLAINRNDLIQLIGMARVCGVPLKYLTTKGQQVRFATQILRKTRARGMVVPWFRKVYAPRSDDTKGKNRYVRTKGYEGALVIKPKAGYYTIQKDGAVFVCDFQSLYPMCIRKNNLCYTTVVVDKKARQQCAGSHRRLAASHDAEKLLTDPHYNGVVVERQWEKDGGWKIAPVYRAGDPSAIAGRNPPFVLESVRRGILLEIEEELMEARAVAKAAMNRCAYGSTKRAVYNSEQNAHKILCNAGYGFTGAIVGRLPNLEISAAITAYGRAYLGFTIYSVESMVEGVNETIYGDTDSVMVLIRDACSGGTTHPGELLQTSDYDAAAKAFVRARLICDTVNGVLQPNMNLQPENLFGPYLLCKKKKYAALRWTDPSGPAGVKASGIESVRRDNPLMLGALCKVFMELIMGYEKDSVTGKSRAVAPQVELGMELLRECHRRILADELPVEAYVITQELKRKPEDYKANMAHVRLAERMAARDPGSAPKPGVRVPYVIVTPDSVGDAITGHKAVTKLYQRSEDPDWVKDHGLKVDVDWYAKSKFEPVFARLLTGVVSPHILNEKVDELKLRRTHIDPHKADLAVNLAIKKRQLRAEKYVWNRVFRKNMLLRKKRVRHRDTDTIVKAFAPTVIEPPADGLDHLIDAVDADSDGDGEDAQRMMDDILRDILTTARANLASTNTDAGPVTGKKHQTQLESFFQPHAT